MRNKIKAFVAATLVAISGTVVTAPPAAAASNTVVGACKGTAVRKCVEVRKVNSDFRGWAKITDIQTDNTDYSIKIVRLKLQRYSTYYGRWETSKTATGDGWYREWDIVRTGLMNWGTESGNCLIRAKAKFAQWNHRTGDVTYPVVYSGKKWVKCVKVENPW